ncbi:uncharacterized protein LOC123723308 [Papilio machaon]|uniref:uncharacterized protein LOC123723308 n=1 Tax=Papilio machaon TaxID=76193 RepID=UPI001E665812|nr:uncharacterized protein LOC123723308 [Papilio machaon]
MFNAIYRAANLQRSQIATAELIQEATKRDVADKSNYRPISLATIIAKVLDSQLNARLNQFLRLHEAQFGFRSDLCTETAILGLKHTVQYYTSRRTPIYACFLDLSRAFDLVSYDILWNKLRERNVPVELLRILQYWYHNQINYVRWADKLLSPYSLNCGVRQGGITSVKLFNLYINDLIVELSSKKIGCRIDDVSINNISYADDMVLLSPTIRAMRNLLACCESYALTHGLVYNVAKSEYLVFGAGGGKYPEVVPVIKLNGTELKRVYQFKYLGHYVTADLKDQVDIERERRALAVRCNVVARSLWTNYTQRAVSALRVQYNNGFRMLMGLPRFCSASGMLAQAGVDGCHAIIRKKSASLLCRLRASSNSILGTIAWRFDSPLLLGIVRRCISNNNLVTK